MQLMSEVMTAGILESLAKEPAFKPGDKRPASNFDGNRAERRAATAIERRKVKHLAKAK